MSAGKTRDIKRRIRSVQSTQQITRAMKMVAAARLRRAQERMLAMRPYCRDLEEMLAIVAAETVGDENPLLTGRSSPQRAALVVMTSDRGLCGSFNNNLIRRAEQFLASEAAALDVHLVTVGAKGEKALLGGRPGGSVENIPDPWDQVTYLGASALAEALCRRMISGELDEAYLLYAEFRTAATQAQVVRRVLPVQAAQGTPVAGSDADGGESGQVEGVAGGRVDSPGIEFDPGIETVTERLLGRFVAAQIYRAMLENLASELGARMTAMDTATRNADDMIAGLTLAYNKARQADITEEMLDIVGGAEALRA